MDAAFDHYVHFFKKKNTLSQMTKERKSGRLNSEEVSVVVSLFDPVAKWRTSSGLLQCCISFTLNAGGGWNE